MKVLKIISACLLVIVIILVTFKVSKGVIEDKNTHYESENPVVKKQPRKDPHKPTDIDRMISHSVPGTGKTKLPAQSDQNLTIYKNKLYVTNSKGKTWMNVPDDYALGYARISDYQDQMSKSNLYISDNNISVVYGGEGSENISIISTRDQGELWSIASISKTATHDVQSGYDKLFIDFLDNGDTGYIAAILKGKVLAFRSVNAGVTWDAVDMNDPLYNKILARFGL